MLMKHENKDIILEKIVKATQPFTRIYSMLNQYKQTTGTLTFEISQWEMT